MKECAEEDRPSRGGGPLLGNANEHGRLFESFRICKNRKAISIKTAFDMIPPPSFYFTLHDIPVSMFSFRAIVISRLIMGKSYRSILLNLLWYL